MKGLYNKSKVAILKWRDANKEQYLEYMSEYNKANKDRLKELMKINYIEKGKERKRIYYLKKKAEKEERLMEVEMIPT
jgi:hypothetical protein